MFYSPDKGIYQTTNPYITGMTSQSYGSDIIQKKNKYNNSFILSQGRKGTEQTQNYLQIFVHRDHWSSSPILFRIMDLYLYEVNY